MSFDVRILNFSGIYEEESFYRCDKSSHFIDLSDISGTNCMCDEMAEKEITQRVFSGAEGAGAFEAQVEIQAGQKLPYGLNFIDNGNYHYMSAIMLERIKEPFSLVVLDHHPDMQRPMFDILSCGGWVMDVALGNEFVRDIHVIGADRKLIDELDEDAAQRAVFHDLEEVFYEEDGLVRVKGIDNSFPIYLSVDKDVISRDEIVTNWDQGEATVDQVLRFIEWAGSAKQGLLGIDICGECAPEQAGCDLGAAIKENDEFNGKVLDLFS
jgi:hypothetical protein